MEPENEWSPSGAAGLRLLNATDTTSRRLLDTADRASQGEPAGIRNIPDESLNYKIKMRDMALNIAVAPKQ